MRLPLAIPNDSRDTNRTQDTWAVNCFVEKDDALRLVKRPGLTSTSYTVPGTVGGGIFIWPSNTGPQTAMIQNDELQFYTPSVVIGDLVNGYYAMVANPSTAPGPDDPYWSITPPPSDRYKGFWVGSGPRGVIATYPESPNYMVGEEAASEVAAAKVWVEKIIGENLAGVAALDKAYDWAPDVVAATFTFNSFPTHTYPYGYAPSGYIAMSVNEKTAFLSSPYPGGWPSGADWTSPFTHSGVIGQVRKRSSTTFFTLTSIGTSAKIVSGLLNGPHQHIEITGCDQPEYNGKFYAKVALSLEAPWDTANEWFFTLSGIPASSTATGVNKKLYFYSPL